MVFCSFGIFLRLGQILYSTRENRIGMNECIDLIDWCRVCLEVCISGVSWHACGTGPQIHQWLWEKEGGTVGAFSLVCACVDVDVDVDGLPSSWQTRLHWCEQSQTTLCLSFTQWQYCTALLYFIHSCMHAWIHASKSLLLLSEMARAVLGRNICIQHSFNTSKQRRILAAAEKHQPTIVYTAPVNGIEPIICRGKTDVDYCPQFSRRIPWRNVFTGGIHCHE